MPTIKPGTRKYISRKSGKWKEGRALCLYPWNDWLDGAWPKSERRILRKGQHFQCAVHGMAQAVRNQARARGIKVSIRINEDCLVITRKGK